MVTAECEKRRNFLRAACFEKPDYIPMHFSINPGCWNNYPKEALKELIKSHSFLFPDHRALLDADDPKYSPYQCKNKPYMDDWGCLWETMEDGITGVVTKHPLENWDSLKDYIPPDPEKCMGTGPINWQRVEKDFSKAREEGTLLGGGLRHGHTFLQLCDLRGYEDLIFDMVDEESRLYELIEIVERFNMEIVKKYVSLAPDFMSYAEDLGMQVGPMLSPEQFRQYIKPSYQRLMRPAKKAGCLIHMHSDGDIRSLFEDIVEGGVDIINLQDIVNGITWIKEHVKGRICVELDIDRQKITRFGTPAQIDDLIREEVVELGSREGGLMMLYGLYLGVPLENIKALMDAMEKYAFYYSG